MRPADTWRDYELLDATNHNRLERWGQTLLIRPDPQVIWKNDEASRCGPRPMPSTTAPPRAAAQWNYHKKLPQKWQTLEDDPHLSAPPAQAHWRFPGAGRELGLVPGKDQGRWPPHPCAEPLRLHGRCDAGLPGRGRLRHPCGCQQRHGGLGA